MALKEKQTCSADACMFGSKSMSTYGWSLTFENMKKLFNIQSSDMDVNARCKQLKS